MFQENRIISQKIWSESTGSWNFRTYHPHWEHVERAKESYLQQLYDSQNQWSIDTQWNMNTQSPLDFSGMRSSLQQASDSSRIRFEAKRQKKKD